MLAALCSSGSANICSRTETFCVERQLREVAYCCRSCQSASAAAHGAALQELLEELLVELAVIKGLHISRLHCPIQVIVLLSLLGLFIVGVQPSLCLHGINISVLL